MNRCGNDDKIDNTLLQLKDIHIRRLTNKSDVDGNPLTTRHMVGNPSGLHLLIKINGAKHWVLRKIFADKRRDIALIIILTFILFKREIWQKKILL